MVINATMNEVLKSVSDFVDKCLGPLSGKDGITPSDITTFLIQICGTILLFVIVRVFLWKPITKFLEARREAMDSELEEAKKHNENAKALEAELEAKYAESKAEIASLIKKAEAEGKLRKEEIINDAKKEAERRISQAESEIEYEISKQEKEIKNQIVTIAFMAAEKIVGHEIKETEYLDLVNKIIDSGLKND